jgi:hypothetical protein
MRDCGIPIVFIACVIAERGKVADTVGNLDIHLPICSHEYLLPDDETDSRGLRFIHLGVDEVSEVVYLLCHGVGDIIIKMA